MAGATGLFAAGMFNVDADAQAAYGLAGFLQPARCYRFAFSVAGEPNWKIIERAEGGWIKAAGRGGARQLATGGRVDQHRTDRHRA